MVWFDNPISEKINSSKGVVQQFQYINQAKQFYKIHLSVPNMKSVCLDILRNWSEQKYFTIKDDVKIIFSSISDNILGSLNQLEYLIDLIDFDNRQITIILSELLVDVFINCILPPTRALISLVDRPVKNLPSFKKLKNGISVRESSLALWYFEDKLKDLYFDFVMILKDCMAKETEQSGKNRILTLFERLFKFPECKKVIGGILCSAGYLHFKPESDVCIVISDSDDDEHESRRKSPENRSEISANESSFDNDDFNCTYLLESENEFYPERENPVEKQSIVDRKSMDISDAFSPVDVEIEWTNDDSVSNKNPDQCIVISDSDDDMENKFNIVKVNEELYKDIWSESEYSPLFEVFVKNNDFVELQNSTEEFVSNAKNIDSNFSHIPNKDKIEKPKIADLSTENCIIQANIADNNITNSTADQSELDYDDSSISQCKVANNIDINLYDEMDDLDFDETLLS